MQMADRKQDSEDNNELSSKPQIEEYSNIASTLSGNIISNDIIVKGTKTITNNIVIKDSTVTFEVTTESSHQCQPNLNLNKEVAEVTRKIKEEAKRFEKKIRKLKFWYGWIIY